MLAVVAITLSKASEQAMINRSDESIKLQNDVFIKTTEALTRIQSSTGVTEKRIEDIISGRVGDISERVANRAVNERLVTGRGRKELEEELKQSILKELLPASKTKEDTEEKTHKLEVVGKQYSKFRDLVTLGLANSENIKAEKIGDGSFSGKEEELVDGLYSANGVRFGVCTFTTNKEYNEEFRTAERFPAFLSGIYQEIGSGFFDRMFLAFDSEFDGENEFRTRIDESSKLIREDIVNKVAFVFGQPNEVVKRILETLPKN